MTTSEDALRTAFSELAPARHSVYAYLSGAFSQAPTVKQLQSLSSALLISEAKQLFSASVVSALQECAKAADSGKEWELKTRQEFMNLFKVPGSQYVMPYESVFRDTRKIGEEKITGLLAGQSSVDVQKWYQLAAVEISDDYKDLPDHIALELNYLGHLCLKEQEFARKCDKTHLARAWEMERDFLAGHVVLWIGMLRDKIWEKSKHTYYRAVAELSADFVRHDLTTLEDLLGPSRGDGVPQYDGIGA